jgi:acyl-CoA thioester hydrolase
MHLSSQCVRGAGRGPGDNRGMPARPRPSTGDFPVQYVTRILFSDLDAQMHVNNIAYARWFQEGRSDFDTGVLKAGLGQSQLRLVLAHVEIDYLASLLYPGSVTVTTGVLRVGSASYTLGHAVFRDDTCHALGQSVMVKLGDGGGAALTDREREVLSGLTITGSWAASA